MARLKNATTLPEALGRAGYVTFGTGKWHNGGASFLKSFQHGESVMLGGMSNHLKVPVQDVKPDGTFTKRRTARKFSSELFADAAIRFLEKQKQGERPFLAYVAFTAPHDPRQPPMSYRQRYYDQRPPLPKNYLEHHPFHTGWMTGRDEQLAAWPRTKADISDQLAEYYGLITHMDDHIGRILAALEQTGRAKNTIIVYAADHGLAVGSHGLLGKQNLYEHSMGCPLVMVGPGIPKGRTAALTYLLDIMPTLCDLTATPIPAGVEGKSLRPIWAGRARGVRDTLFTTYENVMRAVRDDRWKLIRYPLIDHDQLFDLQEDPDELEDLSDRPEHAARVTRMTRLLGVWQRRVADPHPLRVPSPKPKEIDLRGKSRKPDRHQPKWIVDKYFRNRTR